MKILRSLVLVAVGCAVGWFPSSSDAGPFGIFGNKKCTDETCSIHNPTGNTGRGDYNAKGAYTKKVPQVFFDSYLAAPAADAPATESVPDSKAPTANGGHVTESARAPDVPVPSEKTDVDTALAKVAELEAATVEARKDVERAIAEQERAAVLRALKQRQHIDRVTKQIESDIADLKSQLEGLTALEATPEE